MSPVAFPPPPPTSNTLSSRERFALVRSSRKLGKVLGDVPRTLDDDIPPTCTESAWLKRKPTHLPPLLKLSNPSLDTLDSPTSVYHRPPSHRNSVLSVVSNAPSTASGSSTSDAHSDSSHRRAKLERLRRKLGDEVPATAVFPTTPRTAVPRTSTPSTPASSKRGRTRSIARLPRQADDARSVTFSISSDESVHTVTFTAGRVHSPRPHKTKHVYQTGALPPVPPIPAHFASSVTSRRATDNDDAGLIHPRQKLAAGSRVGGPAFKAARRTKREARAQNGMTEPGELVEMVGFMF